MRHDVERFLRKWMATTKCSWQDKTLRGHIFPGGMPILWFGDVECYATSSYKIVTVGLNPSYKEFTEVRFPKEVIKSVHRKNAHTMKEYYEALNKYFLFNPYKKWFSNFERVLNVFDASYGGKMSEEKKCDNCAVHIDLCTPFATYPAWGGLCADLQKKFMDESKELFQSAVSALKPNLIIVSIREEIIDAKFAVVKKVHASGTLSKSVYGFNWAPQQKDARDKIKVLCGRNMRGTPFGGLKIGRGRAIKQLLKKLEKQS